MEYDRLTKDFATEFDILLHKSYSDIEKAGGGRLAEAIRIVRERKALIEPGYDGVFGTAQILPFFANTSSEAMTKEGRQESLF